MAGLIIEEFIMAFDKGLRTLTGSEKSASYPMPELPDVEPISKSDRRRSAGMMRVNHTGEVCAQALYEGQAHSAKTTGLKRMLLQAAKDEQRHLSWCRQRLGELGAAPSVLDPGFYIGSYTIGLFVGLFGDRASLGFVAATEEQVTAHLDNHLLALENDKRSSAIVSQMRIDEQQHGIEALRSGGMQYPQTVRDLMRLASKLMTKTTFWV